jgi:serine/threonine-protein kinase RsbT
VAALMTGERTIAGRVDVESARREAQAAARAAGADAHEVGEIALIATELGTNILRHAGDGWLCVTTYPGGDGATCVRIEARDSGPGIPDVPRAMTEGFTTAGGYGDGLPLVQRLADSVTVESSGAGTSIVAVKWIRSRRG